MAALGSNQSLTKAFGIVKMLKGSNMVRGAGIGAAAGLGASMASGDRHSFRDMAMGGALGAVGGRAFTHGWGRSNSRGMGGIGGGFMQDYRAAQRNGVRQFNKGLGALGGAIPENIRGAWDAA